MNNKHLDEWKGTNPIRTPGGIELAVFALGRFIQYRLDDGMSQEVLTPFMQAYLNLTAALDGREPLALHELPAQIEAAGLTVQPEDPQEWPSWLMGHERLRGHLRAQDSAQNTAGLDVQLKHDSSLRFDKRWMEAETNQAG